jgi:hypothetical protein
MSDEAVKPDAIEEAPPEPKTEVVRITAVEPPEAMLWRHFDRLGKMLAPLGFVPASFRKRARDPDSGLMIDFVNPAEVMAAIAYGHELGLGPMQSLQSLDVIQGKPTLKPETMRALIRAAGHSLVRVEATNEQVTFRGKRRDTGDEETVTYTIEDARALGLAGKDNWRKQPRAMLTARATSEIARSLFSDVIMGAGYTPEEMGDDPPSEPTGASEAAGAGDVPPGAPEAKADAQDGSEQGRGPGSPTEHTGEAAPPPVGNGILDGAEGAVPAPESDPRPPSGIGNSPAGAPSPQPPAGPTPDTGHCATCGAPIWRDDVGLWNHADEFAKHKGEPEPAGTDIDVDELYAQFYGTQTNATSVLEVEAEVVGMPASKILEALRDAGLSIEGSPRTLKMRLLEFRLAQVLARQAQ